MKLIEMQEREPSKPLNIGLVEDVFRLYNTPGKPLACLGSHYWISFEDGWFAEMEFLRWRCFAGVRCEQLEGGVLEKPRTEVRRRKLRI